MENAGPIYHKWPASWNGLIKVMHWVGNQPVRTHRHEFIEIAFIAKGSCLHHYHGSAVRLIPGDIFVITPHEEHSYEIDGNTVIYNCMFYPQVLGEDWAKLQKVKGVYDLLIVEPFYRFESGIQEILHLSPVEAEYMESILKRMLYEEEHPLDGSELMQKSGLITFLCTLGRTWEKQFKENSMVYSSKRNLLADALMFIEKNIKDAIKIEELASKAYLSPSYFRKIFKEFTGLAPIDYINQLRISKAKQLLSDEKMPVSDVGEAVGIKDTNYFSRLFRSTVGCSPSEYRKMSE